MNHRRICVLASAVLLPLLAAACEPEVGSEAWCADMKEKPKGDWTVNEAADFAKHCVLSGLKSD